MQPEAMPNRSLYLWRYTSLPFLLDILIRKRITLISPNAWEDRNDAYLLERYKEKSNYKTVLALCFTKRPETSHHWKIYAGNSSGVCIRFDQKNFLTMLEGQEGILFDDVDYKLVSDLEKSPPKLEVLPFLKRKHYEDEEEFRVVYINREKNWTTKDFEIDLKCINRITISPWTPPSISNTIKRLISSTENCGHIKLIRTGMVEYEPWKRVALKNV